MPATKLTLSADKALIADAKRLADREHTSVSAMFARFLAAFAAATTQAPAALSPLTRRASGLIRLPRNRSDQELLEAALQDRYGARR